MNPQIELKDVTFTYKEGTEAVFNSLSISLPHGVTTLVGQNGTGKSTLLLLAGARLQPLAGTVTINGIDGTRFTDEEARNRLVSFIYQNMEFETDDVLKDIMAAIFQGGLHDQSDVGLIVEIIDVMDLRKSITKKLQQCSKGEMQRAIIAFSLLYGSPYIMMDEPVFALEQKQKEGILSYLRDYAAHYGCSIYTSLHEIDLAMKYADNALLFYKEGRIMKGTREEILTKQNIEEAYQVPWETLHGKQNTFREQLKHPVKREDLKKIQAQVLE